MGLVICKIVWSGVDAEISPQRAMWRAEDYTSAPFVLDFFAIIDSGTLPTIFSYSDQNRGFLRRRGSNQIRPDDNYVLHGLLSNVILDNSLENSLLLFTFSYT